MRKEANDMTNYEKFKNEIEALGYNFGVTKAQEICFCQTMECNDCIFSMSEECSCVPTKVCWLYEEYKESITLMKEEKDFLKILWGSSYIARDYNGQLFLYRKRPVQLSGCWVLENEFTDSDMFEICPDFFEFITWESDKCWSVAELLRMPVKE